MIKRINRGGMTYVIDNVRTAIINIEQHLEGFNPSADDPLFEKKWDVLKETQELTQFISEFGNQSEWDVREDDDAFDKL